MTGPEIKALRKRLNMTQAEFGAMLHHSRWSVMDWESGKTTPPPLEMAKLRELETLNPQGTGQ